MRKATYLDVLEIWDFIWTKRGEVWEGPPTSDPTPYLPLALELGRIEVRGDRYVMVDPGLTLDRLGWTEDDAEGLTLTRPDGTVISLGEAGAEEVFDTYDCPTHGTRRYSRGEVRQAERDETCLYVCTLCGQVADPMPFDAGAEEDPRC